MQTVDSGRYVEMMQGEMPGRYMGDLREIPTLEAISLGAHHFAEGARAEHEWRLVKFDTCREDDLQSWWRARGCWGWGVR